MYPAEHFGDTQSRQDHRDYAYLMRSQERRPNGILGRMEYLITDNPGQQDTRPALVAENPPPATTRKNTQNRRSEPVTDISSKNTNTKNTSSKNTSPTPLPSPSDPAGPGSHSAAPDATGTVPSSSTTAGQVLLWEVSDRVPGLTITSTAATRLGPRLDLLLANGWSHHRLLIALTADTADLTHPRGAVAWRIEDLLNTPAPPPERSALRPVGAAAPTVAAALDRRVYRECPGDDGLCGRPLRGAAEHCPACTGPEEVQP